VVKAVEFQPVINFKYLDKTLTLTPFLNKTSILVLTNDRGIFQDFNSRYNSVINALWYSSDSIYTLAGKLNFQGYILADIGLLYQQK